MLQIYISHVIIKDVQNQDFYLCKIICYQEKKHLFVKENACYFVIFYPAKSGILPV